MNGIHVSNLPRPPRDDLLGGSVRCRHLHSNAAQTILKAKSYRTGHVSIDASDWFFDKHMRERIAKNPGVGLATFKKAYMGHLLDRANYYDGPLEAGAGQAGAVRQNVHALRQI